MSAALHGVSAQFAAVSQFWLCALVGGGDLSRRQYHPAAVLHAIETQRVIHVILVPTMLNRLLNSPEFAASDLSSLTHCVYGASIMPEAVLRRALARLPKVRFIQSYGMTEFSPGVRTSTPAKSRMRCTNIPACANVQ